MPFFIFLVYLEKDYIADIVKDNTYWQEQGLFESCYNKKTTPEYIEYL